MNLNKVRDYVYFGGLLFATLLFMIVVKPFFYPIFWAAVLASIFYPLYKRITRLLQPNAGAFLTLFIITLIILVPLSMILTVLVRELIGVFDTFNSHQTEVGQIVHNIDTFLRSNSFITTYHLNDNLIAQRIADVGQNLVTFVYESVKSVTQNSVAFIALFVLMLYTLFFFLRDGQKIMKKIMFLVPLGKKNEQLLYEKFTSTVGATIKGTLIVGGIQGTLGGILFLITGVPNPLIWGIAMALFATIPVTGTGIIWLPAGIIMLLTGHLWQGITILAAGVLIVSTIDNVLKPIIVGKDIQMHPVVVLFSTLGGVIVFGLSGFVIGPIIAAFCQTFWEMYEEYYKDELIKS